MPEINVLEIDIDAKRAADLFVHHLLMATRLIMYVPDHEAPHGLLRRMAKLTNDPIETEVARVFIDKIVSLYDESGR